MSVVDPVTGGIPNQTDPEGSFFLPKEKTVETAETQAHIDELIESFYAECFAENGEPETVLEQIAASYSRNIIVTICDRIACQTVQLRGIYLTQHIDTMADFELQQYLGYINRIINNYLNHLPKQIAAVALKEVM